MTTVGHPDTSIGPELSEPDRHGWRRCRAHGHHYRVRVGAESPRQSVTAIVDRSEGGRWQRIGETRPRPHGFDRAALDDARVMIARAGGEPRGAAS